MSWKASAYVKTLVECPNGERISRTEKLVALVLADSHQEKAHAFTFPSVKTIAEDSLMDPRVCRRVLASLERKGVIERQRAQNQGRGQLTFYRFPALDSLKPKGGQVVPLSLPNKADAVSSLFLAERRTEGGRKEDKTAPPSIEEQEQELKNTTPPNPLASEGEDGPNGDDDAGKTKTGAAGVAMAVCDGGAAAQPVPAMATAGVRAGNREMVSRRVGGGARDRVDELQFAVDQVCAALSVVNGRKRKLLRAVIEDRAREGKTPAETAEAMIAAWNCQADNSAVLRVKLGLAKFFGEGYWRDSGRWFWDEERLRMRSETRVGSGRFM